MSKHVTAGQAGEPGWVGLETADGAVHVVPVDDFGEHELSCGCSCEPYWDEDDSDEDAGVWVHNSFDGRDRKLN